MGVVLHRGGEAEAAGMQVDPLAEVSDILRGFVGNARDVVLENQHGRGMVAVGRNFLDIDDRAVGDAAHAIEPFAAAALDFLRRLWLAPEHGVRGVSKASAAKS